VHFQLDGNYNVLSFTGAYVFIFSVEIFNCLPLLQFGAVELGFLNDVFPSFPELSAHQKKARITMDS
jgi:hypothetical protein